MENAKISNGWLYGVIMSIILGVCIGALVGWSLKSFIITIVVMIPIAVIFFWLGLRELLIGHSGALLFLGKRYNQWSTSEGWVWWFPYPLGDIIPVDIRKRELEVNPTKVLSADGTPIDIDVSVEVRIDDPSIWLGVNDADSLVIQQVDRVTREVIGILSNDNIKNNPQSILKILDAVFQNGTIGDVDINAGSSPEAQALSTKCLEELEIERIGDITQDNWGISVLRFFVTDLRFPVEIENARTQKTVEEAQRTSETIELNHFKERLLELVRDTGLTAQEAVNVIQSERGKATKVIIDGNATSLERAAALVSGALNNTQTGA